MGSLPLRVFEEYGYPRDTKTKFPYSFINTKGERQLTSCNDTEIKGVHSTTWVSVFSLFQELKNDQSDDYHQFNSKILSNRPILFHIFSPGGPDDGCSLDDNNNSPCRFRPDLTATTGPSSSLMSMQFLPTVTDRKFPSSC